MARVQSKLTSTLSRTGKAASTSTAATKTAANTAATKTPANTAATKTATNTAATKTAADTAATKTAADTTAGAPNNTASSASSDSRFKGVTRTLIVSFFEVFGDNRFRDSFDTANFDRLQALRWIRNSPLPAAQRIVHAVSEKANKRDTVVNHSTITAPDDPVMLELGTRQVYQTFQAGLALHTYAIRDRRVEEAFKITFLNRQCSLSFLNAGGFIQRVLRPADNRGRREPILAPTRKPSVFEILLWFHCINMVSDMFDKRQVTLKVHYSTGNLIGYVVHRVCLAWGKLVGRIGQGGLSTHLLPYLWYNDKTGCFECLPREDGFSSTSQLQSLVPSVRPIKSGTGIDAAAAARNGNTDRAMRHVAHALLYKLKKLTCDSVIHSITAPRDVVDYPQIRALTRADGDDGLPYVFAEMDDEAMEILGIAKPVPSPIEVINVDDAGASEVGRVTKIPATMHDPSLMFGANSLNRQQRSSVRKRTMVTTSSTRARKQQRIQGGGQEEEDEITAVGTPTVKEEPELFVAPEPAQSEEFDEQTQKAFDVLVKAMADRVCVAYNTPFDETAEAHSGGCGEELKGKVQLVMTDPPWNYRRERKLDNSEHDVLSDEDMKRVVDAIIEVLAPGGHVIIFCSAYQFRRWVQLFSSKRVKVIDYDEDDPDKEVIVEKKPFEVERNPLYFQRAPGFYQATPSARRLTHLSTTEQAIHVWRTGCSAADNFSRVNYERGGFVPSRHKGYTDCIDNIPRLTPQEKVYTDEVNSNDRPKMLRPEQKSVALLKTIISKYSQPGDIVFDPFAGSYSTGRSCMSLLSHRRCIMGDQDERCGKFSMRQLVEVYARQILNEESDITGTDDLKACAATYVHQMDKINALKDISVWEIPKGYTPMQAFPPTLVNFIGSSFHDNTLYDLYRTKPLIEWPPLWRARLHQMDPDVLLGFEIAASNLEMKQSSIPGAGKGIFTKVRIPPDTVIGYYYGAVVYVNLSINKARRPGTYGEGILEFDVNDFEKWAVELNRKTETGQTVWIFPAPFCAMRMINDARYREDEVGRPTRAQIAANPDHYRHNNVRFHDVSNRQSMSDFRSHGMVEIRSLRNVIPAGSELFVDYGPQYKFP